MLTKSEPEYIIPFSIGRDQAVSIFEEHCSMLEHLPKKFITKEKLSAITGVYVPSYIVSSEVEANLSGMADEEKRSTDYDTALGNFKGRVYAKAIFRLKNIPFDCEKSIPDRFMASAEPFDYSDLVEIKPEYLKDYSVLEGDEETEVTDEKINERLYKYAYDFCSGIDLGYKGFVLIEDECSIRMFNQETKCVLLPVWLLKIEFGGILYQFIINGQTGKLSGEFPKSKGWEKKEERQRKSRISRSKREFFFYLFEMLWPVIVFAVLIPALFLQPFALNYFFEHPVEALFLLIACAAIIVLLMKLRPRFLSGHSKKMKENLEGLEFVETNKMPSSEAYIDNKYPMQIYETDRDSLFG